jgi:ribosomal-protein-alanine N-acetyltransferase
MTDATFPLPGVLVRGAKLEDLGAVLEIERASFADPWSRSSFTALLERPRVYFAVAVDRATGAVLGHVVAWFVVDESELANLAVLPAARNRGIGSLLLNSALVAAAERGSLEMYLEVRASNAPAIALYTSHGFAEVGRRRGYYRKPVEDALVLRRAPAIVPTIEGGTQRK